MGSAAVSGPLTYRLRTFCHFCGTNRSTSSRATVSMLAASFSGSQLAYPTLTAVLVDGLRCTSAAPMAF